jgi:hypothetical protein
MVNSLLGRMKDGLIFRIAWVEADRFTEEHISMTPAIETREPPM